MSKYHIQWIIPLMLVFMIKYTDLIYYKHFINNSTDSHSVYHICTKISVWSYEHKTTDKYTQTAATGKALPGTQNITCLKVLMILPPNQKLRKITQI